MVIMYLPCLTLSFGLTGGQKTALKGREELPSHKTVPCWVPRDETRLRALGSALSCAGKSDFWFSGCPTSPAGPLTPHSYREGALPADNHEMFLLGTSDQEHLAQGLSAHSWGCRVGFSVTQVASGTGAGCLFPPCTALVTTSSGMCCRNLAYVMNF